MPTSLPTNAAWEMILEEFKHEFHQLKPSYERLCLLAYLLWTNLPKNGCAGRVTSTLAELHVRKNTFYSWVREHRVKIGEIEDSDITEDPGQVTNEEGPGPDDQGCEIQDSSDDPGTAPITAAPGSTNQPQRRGKAEVKTYTLHLEGARLKRFKNALLKLRQFYPYGSDSEAMYQSVIRAAENLTSPLRNEAGVTQEGSDAAA